MNERYTPSEHLEAADKAKQHEKGREQAKFYRYFLDNLKNRIVGQLLREDLNKQLGNVDINKTDLPLSKFEFCDAQNIKKYVVEAMNEANEFAGTSENTAANPNKLASMTPVEFYRYIENLKASLIKE